MFYSILIDLHQLIYLLRSRIVIFKVGNKTKKDTEEISSVPFAHATPII